MGELTQELLKVSDLLSRTQKLPNSLWLLKDQLEAKRGLFEAKLRATEKKLHQSRASFEGHHQVSDVFETKDVPGLGDWTSDLQTQLTISNSKIEALSQEIK